MKSGLKIGVLAVQGAFIEHKRMLESLGCECVELRRKSDICDLDGLVLPGGESTVQGKLLRELDMFDELKERIANGLPVLAKDGRNQMSPITKAEKRIQNGPEDSVKSFYDVAKVIAQGKLIPGRRTGEPGAEEESR